MTSQSLMPAVGAGFGVIRRAPGAVLIWGLIALVLALAPTLASLAIAGPAAIAPTGSSSPGALGAMLVAQGVQTLLGIVLGIVNMALLTPAAYRAVLFPTERRAFFLRLGKTELHMAVFGVVMFVMFFLAALVVLVPLILIFAGAGSGLARGDPAAAVAAMGAAVLLMFVFMIPVLILFMYPFCRLWMGSVMTVAEGELRLFDGWAFTRGYGWRLVGINLLLFVIMVGILVGVFIVAALIFAVAGLSFGSLAGSMSQASITASAVVAGLVGLVLYVAVISVFQAMTQALWAKAYEIIRGGAIHSHAEVFS